jgi:hypothetical protein
MLAWRLKLDVDRLLVKKQIDVQCVQCGQQISQAMPQPINRPTLLSPQFH